jgi:hypothetical protein
VVHQGFQILCIRLRDCSEVLCLTRRPVLNPSKTSGTHFMSVSVDPQGHIVVGMLMSIEKEIQILLYVFANP